MKKNAVMLLGLWLLAACATAPLSKEQARDIEQLMEFSGHLELVHQFPAMVKLTIRQNDAQAAEQIPEKILQRMIAGVDRAVDPSRMTAAIAKAVAKELDGQEIASLLSWYRSETGQKVRRAAEASTRAEQIPTTRQLLSDAKRVALAEDIDALTRETEFVIKMQTHIQVAAVAAWYGADNPQSAVPLDSIHSRIGSRIAGNRDGIRQAVITNTLQTCHRATDTDLEAYAGFCRTSAAKGFFKTARAEISRQMAREIEELIEELTEQTFDKSSIG